MLSQAASRVVGAAALMLGSFSSHAGLIVNGDRNEASERIYHSHFPDLSITTIPEINEFSKESIQQAAKLWIEQLP